MSTPDGAESLIVTAIALQYFRRFANLDTRLPTWTPYIKRVWVIGGILYALAVVLSIDSLSTGWFWLASGAIILYVIWQVREYRPAKTFLFALAPFYVIRTLNTFLEQYAPNFHKANEDYIESAEGFSFVWLITFMIIAHNQKKSLEKQRVEREQEAEQRRIIEARKQELEYLVSERTAEITHQKEELERALNELKVTQTQLIQSEKMASLGELTAGIAHEIQNPLNFVNNFSEVSVELIDELAQEQQKPERDTELEADLLADLKQNLQKISHHGGRASSIVKGMLQHSRASTGQREPTNLNALADEYLRLAYHGLRAKDKTFNAKLVTDFDDSLGLISVVPQDLGRVMLNLFTNAFYAVQQRQKRNDPTYQPTVTVRTRCVNGQAILTVADNGIGIPDELQAKIFQPFFTTKPTGEGTGLGLSLSYDIVTKGHSGTMSVQSKEGSGTQFDIHLPA